MQIPQLFQLFPKTLHLGRWPRVFNLLAEPYHDKGYRPGQWPNAIEAPLEAAFPVESTEPRPPCPCCGGRMIIIETFQRWMQLRAPPVCPAPTGTVTP
jgi:hypothetical protein